MIKSRKIQLRIIRLIVLVSIFMLFSLQLSVQAEVLIDGKLVRERIVESGGTYQGTILLKNKGEAPEKIKIYQTDYSFSCEGVNNYSQPAGQGERSNADWITFNPSYLVIPPGETAEVNYWIKVPLPLDNPLVGTYWSMLMIESIGEDNRDQGISKNEEVNNKDKNVKVNIRQIMRYGIQMVTNIGESGERKLKIIDQKLLKQEGEGYLLQLDVENRGERWLKLKVWAELYGLQEGRLAGKFEGGSFIIYPGTSVRYRINLDGISANKYKALVVLDNQDEYVWGIQYNLDL